MKKLTCNQLGGACDLEFLGATFEEIAEQSKQHGMEMFQKADKPHLAAMEKMKQLMQAPDAMQKWFAEKKQLFDDAPNLD